MSNLKYYNTTTSAWETLVIGKQGPTGATGPTGPTGPGVPSQTGNSGTLLTTNGTATSWSKTIGNSSFDANIANIVSPGVTSGLNATRSLNMVDTSAVMKIVRTDGTTNAAGVEFQTWSADLTTNLSYWDIAGNQDNLFFRKRFGGPDINILSFSSAGNAVFSGTISSTRSLAIQALNVASGVDFSNAGLETRTASTGNPALAFHAAGSTAMSLIHIRGQNVIQVASNGNNVDTTQKSIRNITLSTSAPSGGADGDVWLQHLA
jgi:hypothetical protein